LEKRTTDLGTFDLKSKTNKFTANRLKGCLVFPTDGI
jgi:hypothetical protein